MEFKVAISNVFIKTMAQMTVCNVKGAVQSDESTT